MRSIPATGTVWPASRSHVRRTSSIPFSWASTAQSTGSRRLSRWTRPAFPTRALRRAADLASTSAASAAVSPARRSTSRRSPTPWVISPAAGVAGRISSRATRPRRSAAPRRSGGHPTLTARTSPRASSVRSGLPSDFPTVSARRAPFTPRTTRSRWRTRPSSTASA